MKTLGIMIYKVHDKLKYRRNSLAKDSWRKVNKEKHNDYLEKNFISGSNEFKQTSFFKLKIFENATKPNYQLREISVWKVFI